MNNKHAIALMAAVIYGTMRNPLKDDAIEQAFQIFAKVESLLYRFGPDASDVVNNCYKKS